MKVMDLEALAEAWRRRASRAREERRNRAQQARRAAEEAAQMLVRDFGASEVWLFGSLANEPRRDEFDVDLAARGLPPGRYFEAVARASEVVDRPVDLVRLETCPDATRRRIESTGRRIAHG